MPPRKAKDPYKPPAIAPPASTGNAGPSFEAKVGAFYLLSLLGRSEPRGLPGASVRAVELQRRIDEHPLDDVIVQAVNADGSPATLEIQVKRALTFTASDLEFRDVVGQIADAAKKSEFKAQRYELAVAVARTTTRIEFVCQEVLHWARQLPDAMTFAAHIERPNFASDDMRNFVAVFRANLAQVGAPTDDEALWQLLRHFQILVFDFESPGSDYEYRARERARSVLAPADRHRAADLWAVLLDYVGASARASGALEGATLSTVLQQQHKLLINLPDDLRVINDRLADEAERVLAEINDEVGGVRLARTGLVDQAHQHLEDHRILHIVGAPGCGKSAVMKHLARRLQHEGRIIALRNGRVTPGGWQPLAHLIGCQISQSAFFNELGCGGGAVLFIDNIDQIDGMAEWATISDLLTGVVKSPGWRAVVTGGAGNDEWKTKLPAALRRSDIATLAVEPISDEEVKVLSAENKTLGLILGPDHPAKGIARNLFYLSRLVEFGVGDAESDAGVVSELDLARLWWRYAGGRGEDNGRFARLKLLRQLGSQVIADPGRSTFKVDELDSPTLVELLNVHSLHEVIKGATISFRHDVLRDWTVGFMLHDDKGLLNSLPMNAPLPAGLGRGLEITARLALATDNDGRAWLELLAAVEREGSPGSWKRPILLALTRSEHAVSHMIRLKRALLENGGRRMSDLIRLMIAIDSVPLTTLVARLQPTTPIPKGIDDLVIPKGAGWIWLVLWLVAEAGSLPNQLIPDVVKVFQAWLIYAQNESFNVNAEIVRLLFEWLALIEGRLEPRTYRRIEDAPPPLNIPHMREVRDRIQLTVFTNARHNPAAAAKYLSGLASRRVGHHDQRAILTSPGALAGAAPKEYVDFALASIIERGDPDDRRYRRRRYGPFGAHDHLFTRPSPSQGPFLDLLEHAPAEGLRLIRGLVEQATEWRRRHYRDDRRSFPKLTIPFPDGPKSFEGDWSVYHWVRSVAPSTVTASALMALEAWGHQQIEQGRPFAEVLRDVLGPDGSSVAFVLVAVDLILSHWSLARDHAWPFVATPELLVFDGLRHTRDITGVDRLSALDGAIETGRVKRSDLDARLSRRVRLIDTFGEYAFGPAERLAPLQAALEQACLEIRQGPADPEEDLINGLRATAARALRMTDAKNWLLVKVRLEDGSEADVHQYQADPAEQQLIDGLRARSDEDMQHMNVRIRVQKALLEPGKSTPAIVLEGIEWAKRQTVVAGDDDDFKKEWDRRAVVMSAALAARDYEGADRESIIDWALGLLRSATAQRDKEYVGNEQIEYNVTALATVGLIALYLKNGDIAVRDLLLKLAMHGNQAVLHALGRQLVSLAQKDERLVRTLIRIIMKSCIYRRTAFNEEISPLKTGHQAEINELIQAEKRALADEADEPPWPTLPSWGRRSRPRLRLPGGPPLEEKIPAQPPDAYVDDQRLGALIGHLLLFSAHKIPPWLVSLTDHLLLWTIDANGPADEHDDDNDSRPLHWNRDFFDFAGVLSVALPHVDAVKMFIDPMVKFGEDAFHETAASFLRGFDRATLANNTKDPEKPDEVRTLLAERLKQTWNYQRFRREKTFTCESHAGDMWTAIFYQPPFFMSRGETILPANWAALDKTIRILTDLVTGAPTSGCMAVLFLNLLDTSPRAALIPFAVQAASAWTGAYGADTHFWSERDIGPRLCSWLGRTISEDAASAAKINEVRDPLFKCLDILIRSGVSQANEIESRITAMRADGLGGR